MIDLSKTTAPKTDQVNFDDFANGESRIIKITGVKGVDSKEQPIIINFEGDNGKPYKPCLSMRRVLVRVWGKNGLDYVGRYLELYGDPKVVYAGLAVGGIRIKAMSHITEPVTMALTASKSVRKPYTVQPLKIDVPKVDPIIDTLIRDATKYAEGGLVALEDWFKGLPKDSQSKIKPHLDKFKQVAEQKNNQLENKETKK